MGAIDTFFDAWGMSDDAARRDAIGSVSTDATAYADPRTPSMLNGPDAIATYVNAFSANAPGWTAKVVKEDTTAGFMRVTVAFGGEGPDGSEMVQHGQYFAEHDTEGRILRLIGFVGTGTPE